MMNKEIIEIKYRKEIEGVKKEDQYLVKYIQENKQKMIEKIGEYKKTYDNDEYSV